MSEPDDDLLREQEGTGYGEDEGERDAALDELDDEPAEDDPEVAEQ